MWVSQHFLSILSTLLEATLIIFPAHLNNDVIMKIFLSTSTYISVETGVMVQSRCGQTVALEPYATLLARGMLISLVLNELIKCEILLM